MHQRQTHVGAPMITFISYKHEDKEFADQIADLLNKHYVKFCVDRRLFKGGSIQRQIDEQIAECKKFVLLISPDTIDSEWVPRELAAAMERPDLKGKNILPLMVRQTPPDNWQSLHPDIKDQKVFDLTGPDRERVLTEIIEEEYNRPRFEHEYWPVGDVEIQVLILVGGNGTSRFRVGDIICDGPTSDRKYDLPDDIAFDADERIAEAKADCDSRGARFFNGKQVRLIDYSFGGHNEETGGATDKPMRLKLGWTEYFNTRLTNQSRHHVLADGNSIALRYGRDLENFSNSGLSNPIAANMSVVTSDRKIFFATRGEMAWNPGNFQPAVSGDGQPEDVFDGVYDPFHTAIREASEECAGNYPFNRSQATIFGLARTMGTQFPFVFGEIRLPITSTELLGYLPKDPEGQRKAIDFTIEGVCDWVAEYHLDQFKGKRGGVIGTTLFSLLQSIQYEYPDRWQEVIQRLTRK